MTEAEVGVLWGHEQRDTGDPRKLKITEGVYSPLT